MIAKNKIIFMMLGIFLVIVSLSVAEAASWDWNKSINVVTDLNLTIDSNQVTIETKDSTYSYSCLIDRAVNLKMDTNWVYSEREYCPSLESIYEPFINMHKACDTNISTSLNSMISDFNNYLSGYGFYDFNGLLDNSQSTINENMQRLMNDYWAKVTNTWMPTQERFDSLENENSELKKLIIQGKSDLNNAQTMAQVKDEVIKMNNDQINLWRSLFLIALIVMVIIIAKELDLGEMLFGGTKRADKF